MFKRFIGSFTIILATLSPVMAADDPSMHDVYEAANGGHIAQAQDMIGKVLQSHPNSAKAHYVAAEIDAKQGQLGGAREQLQAAERLAPGLPFAKPEAVQALRAQLGIAGQARAQSRASGQGLSMGMMLLIGAGVGLVIITLIRRLSPPAQASYPAAYPQAGNGYAPTAGMPPSGGGMGSGIMGGLASGLAVGAGVVAGEALMHRMMDGGDRGRLADSSQGDSDARGNADMGGNNFGTTDSGSWDDSSSNLSDSGGGDDWS